MKTYVNIVFVVFSLCVLVIVAALNIKGNTQSLTLLEDSIKSQLISITSAAREIIDINAFQSYNSEEDFENDLYETQLRKLRMLAISANAKYIYALKMIDGEAYFIFDTDPLAEIIFEPYELNDVHKQAFAGKSTSGIMNVVDDYGAFNTGAVPIMKDGKIIGIVAADIEDTFVAKSISQNKFNTILMVCVLAAVFIFSGLALYQLLKRIKKMQDELARMANYDKLTSLPNRRYLLDLLEKICAKGKRDPFALYFIDMDNFKAVNDDAGHDAGDELLQHTAQYLQTAHSNSTAFRPGSGSLNVTARIGGDEFVLIVPGIVTTEEAALFANELIDGFLTIGVDKYVERYNVGLSVGVALFPSDTENHHVLIKYADIAMYNAKHTGKNSFSIYQPEMGQEKTIE